MKLKIFSPSKSPDGCLTSSATPNAALFLRMLWCAGGRIVCVSVSETVTEQYFMRQIMITGKNVC